MARRNNRRNRRRVCSFCTDNVTFIDYKEPEQMTPLITDHGRILPRRKTGTCAKHQRRLSTAIKRARHLALIPYTVR